MAFSESTLSLDMDEVLARREIEELADEDLITEEVVQEELIHPEPVPIMWFHQDNVLGLVEEEPLPEEINEQPVEGPGYIWDHVFDQELEEYVDLYEDWEMEDGISDAESVDWDDLLEGLPLHVDDNNEEWNRFVAPAG